jgi:hypothetical protein
MLMVDTAGILLDLLVILVFMVLYITSVAIPVPPLLGGRSRIQPTVQQLTVGRWELEVRDVVVMARAVVVGFMAAAVHMVPELAEDLVSRRAHLLLLLTEFSLAVAKLP